MLDSGRDTGIDRITGLGKSRGRSEGQKNGNTAPKLPLYSMQTDGTDCLPLGLFGSRWEFPSGGVWVFVRRGGQHVRGD